MQTETNKRRMQDLTEAERAEAVQDMEKIIEADIARREAREARRHWQHVNVTLNPRVYEYIKGRSEATGQPIRRICAEIITQAADQQDHEEEKGGSNIGKR